MTIQIRGKKITDSEKQMDKESKLLAEEEIKGIPAGYESDLEESITFTRHIIEEGCCKPDPG